MTAPRSLALFHTYVGFTAAHEALVRLLAPRLDEALDGLVADFYARILDHQETRSVLQDEAQVERLKETMRHWTRGCVGAPRDEAYYEQRYRIGRRHLEVGLPLHLVPLAMQVVRQHLVELAARVDPNRVLEICDAIDRMLQVEQAIVIESYLDVYTEALAERERWSTIHRLSSVVSDELKNPLGVVHTSMLLLRRNLEKHEAAAADPTLHRHFERIERAVSQATALAANLHEYARVQEPRRRRVPIREVVEHALQLIESRRSDAIEIRCQVEPENAEVEVDPTLLAKALAHLLRNSIECITESKGRGSVRVIARQEGNDLRVVVEDDGPGIDEEILDRVWQPLVTHRAESTGLGLGIARNVVLAHGGAIDLKTSGNGTRFTIRLPVVPGASVADKSREIPPQGR